MPDRDQLIEQKNQIIQQQRILRNRAAANPKEAARLTQTIQHLAQEERRLRLAIDRTPPAMPTLTPLSKEPPHTFDVLILAGYDRDKPDPLTERTGEPHKVLVPIGGHPMIWHTVQTLRESQRVGEIVIMGLLPEEAPDFGCSVHLHPDHGSLYANQRAGALALADLNSQDRFILVTSGDVPLLTGEMVDWFIQACAPYEREGYWGVVQQGVMEETFPNSQRSYLNLTEGKLCSGDLFLIQLSAGLRIQPYMNTLIGQRKSVWRQLQLFGFETLIRLLFRRLSLDWILARVGRRLDIKGAAVQLPFAEAGMDVDKPHQLDQVLTYLQRHPDHPVNQRAQNQGMTE